MVARRHLVSIIVMLSLAFAREPARSQVVQPDYWGTDGTVRSIARVGNTVYIAGDFSSVGPATGGGVPIDRSSGVPVGRFPRVAGMVHAVVSDGHGGWFVGGDFAGVEGRPHRNLAHLLADGSVADWDPHVDDVEYVIRSGDVDPIGIVAALALQGDTLFVGGRLQVVGGQARHALAAVDARTGAVLPWDAHADGLVSALAVHDGTLYVGGLFRTMGGARRYDLAAFDLADGSITPWNPTADGNVLAIVIARNVAYVGGEFDHVGGQPRNSIAAVALDTGAVTAWDAGLRPLRSYIAHGSWIWPYVAGIVVHGNTLYAGGYFDVAGGESRYALAALDVATARATSFDAHIGGGEVKTLARHGQTLYVGGYVYFFGDQHRPNLAALDARTGQATSWNPRPNAPPLALAVDGNTVYAGGWFTSVYDWEPRSRLAALDATSGKALPWSPSFDVAGIHALAAGAGRVYVAGDFTSVEGHPRGHLAAFDGATGALTDWNPSPVTVEPRSLRLSVIGSVLYVAGRFESIGGVARHNLAAIDGVTGAMLPWAPNPHGSYESGRIGALSTFENMVFVAGNFDTIGGAPRHVLAALDGTTGLATVWDTPGESVLGVGYPSSLLLAVAANERAVYLGAWFYDVPGRAGLLGFDSAGGLVPWGPTLGTEYDAWIVGRQPTARALAFRGQTLFVAGKFDTIAGRPLPNLAAVDATTGDVLDWDPDMRGGFGHPFDEVDALTLSDDVLYVGGWFNRLGEFPCANFAALSLAPVLKPRQEPVAANRVAGPAFAMPAPNPAHGVTRLSFTLPSASVVSLAVFDLAGRRVATLIDHELETAGTHAVLLGTTHLRAGVYYCLLEVGHARLTRRVIVVD